MYDIIYTGQFKKSLRLCVKRGLDIQAFTTVLDILQEKGELHLLRTLSGIFRITFMAIIIIKLQT